MNAREELIRWADETGPLSARALAILQDVTFASARARLAAAERSGLMRSARPLAGAGRLYVPTREGLRGCGLGGGGQPVPGPAIANHAQACAVVAARLQRSYPLGRVLGETGLRRLERAYGRPVASAALTHGALGRAAVHRPDLVLWTDACPAGLPVAIEVELTVKGAVRLRAICRAWARTEGVAGVLYLVSAQTAGPVGRALQHASARGRVSLLAIDALEGAEPGPPPLERTVAVHA